MTGLELRRRLEDRLAETSADLWPTVAERNRVVLRVSQEYRADARKHPWLVQEQADLYAGEPVYVVYRALRKVFRDPLKARAEAVKGGRPEIKPGDDEMGFHGTLPLKPLCIPRSLRWA